MNRTIKDAMVERFPHESHDQLRHQNPAQAAERTVAALRDGIGILPDALTPA